MSKHLVAQDFIANIRLYEIKPDEKEQLVAFVLYTGVDFDQLDCMPQTLEIYEENDQAYGDLAYYDMKTEKLEKISKFLSPETILQKSSINSLYAAQNGLLVLAKNIATNANDVDLDPRIHIGYYPNGLDTQDPPKTAYSLKLRFK